MRVFLSVLFLGTFFWTSAQEDFLAQQYLNNGEFDKAVVYFERLVKSNPNRIEFSEGLVACYQQLERYQEAENFLRKKIKSQKDNPILYINLGYNFSLQNKNQEAEKPYQKALNFLKKHPNYASLIGAKFQQYSLLDYAIKAYKKAMEINPTLNYNVRLAKIYGEQGHIEQMYASYLTLIEEKRTSKSNVLRSLDAFISSDPTANNNILLKRLLLKNAQKNPNILWNEMLSWLFIKQKQYTSAFRQEKAIYKRTEPASVDRLLDLSDLALSLDAIEVAKDIFEFVLQQTKDSGTQLDSELKLIHIQLLKNDSTALESVEKKYKNLVKSFGKSTATIRLHVAYAKFLTFKKNTPEPAIKMLKDFLDIPMQKGAVAYIKFALAEILVYHKKFNEALIYFSQIQQKFKNDVIGQNARFKVAQTSFYKGDFNWALTQLKVLRSSTSQLIANDAMQLSLLISDNTLEDSTQTALRKYARADFLAYQNKTKEAVTLLEDILENHKGEKIEDEALLKQGELLQKLQAYAKAVFNYQKIIEFYGQGILADDAHFALGTLYEKKLQEPEKAKDHYEKILYHYQDSYYSPIARKRFRTLRGDVLN